MPITLHLDAETEQRLKDAAAARGVTPETLVQEAIEAWTVDDDWEEDERRMAEPGDDIPVDQAFEELRARVAAARNVKD